MFQNLACCKAINIFSVLLLFLQKQNENPEQFSKKQKIV